MVTDFIFLFPLNALGAMLVTAYVLPLMTTVEGILADVLLLLEGLTYSAVPPAFPVEMTLHTDLVRRSVTTLPGFGAELSGADGFAESYQHDNRKGY